MARIVLSREAAMKAIEYSNEANEQLIANINVMDNNVNSQFEGLTDPTIKKYIQLSEQMQNLLRQVGAKMEAISDYCKTVIDFINKYEES